MQRFINPNSLAGGNGTTTALTGVNRAYHSQAEFEAAEQTDLVAAGDIMKFTCAGGRDDTNVSYSGWVTSATSYIEGNSSDFPADGVFDSSKYYLDEGTSGGSGILIGAGAEFFRLFNMQHQRQSLAVSSADRECIEIPSSVGVGDIRIWGGIFKSIASDIAGQVTGILFSDSSPNYSFMNLTFEGFSGSSDRGMSSGATTPVSEIYNCTFIDCETGIMARAAMLIKNCIFQDCPTDIGGPVNSGNDYNLTDGVSIPGANSVANATLTFVDKAGGNFALVAGDTDAIGAGIGPSSDANVPLNDIIGTARSGATTDIGAFVFVGGGGGVTGTITQSTQSFTQSLTGSVVNQFSGAIEQTASSFTQSAVGGFTNADFTGVINQTLSSFTQSATGDFTEIITGTINQTTSSFAQSLSGAVVNNITGTITVTMSAFTQSATGAIPIPVVISDGLVGSGSLGLGVNGFGALGGGIIGSGNI